MKLKLIKKPERKFKCPLCKSTMDREQTFSEEFFGGRYVLKIGFWECQVCGAKFKEEDNKNLGKEVYAYPNDRRELEEYNKFID